jgi:hypothetical protein
MLSRARTILGGATWSLLVAVLVVVATAAGADARSGRCRRDADCDGLTNKRERALGTKVSNADTDHDGLSDGKEVDHVGCDPTDADSDDDGVDDGDEVAGGSDPKDADTDDDGKDDGDDGDRCGELQPKLVGPVDAVDVAAKTVKVFGLVIDATNARMHDDKTLEAVVVGRFVKVVLDGTKLPDLVATKIELMYDDGPDGDSGDDGEKKSDD